MIYKVTLRDEVTYYIEATNETNAIDEAHEFWAERSPEIKECEQVSPCQVNGKCPFMEKCSCSQCMKEGR